MRRDLSLPIPEPIVPVGFSIRRWRMESEAEQRQYLEGRNACFPEAPTSLDKWRYFASTPLWERGTNMAAFAADQLAASVLVFWQPGSPTGFTEYVFTLAGYRGHGLALFNHLLPSITWLCLRNSQKRIKCSDICIRSEYRIGKCPL